MPAGCNSRPLRSVGPLVRPGQTVSPVRHSPSRTPTYLAHIGRQPPCFGPWLLQPSRGWCSSISVRCTKSPGLHELANTDLLLTEGTVCPISFVKDVLVSGRHPVPRHCLSALWRRSISFPITRRPATHGRASPPNLHTLLPRHWPTSQPPVLVCHSSLDTRDGMGEGGATGGCVP